MMTELSPHFALEEFACHDGTAYPCEKIDLEAPPGADGLPRSWQETRLQPLVETLEVIREACGKPIIIDSAYRTLEYDQRLYDKDRDHNGLKAKPEGSQHPKGRAVDIVCRSMTALELRDLIGALYRAGRLPHLGGLGLYPSFVHIDVRPRDPADHLSQWGGTRLSNIP